MSSDVTSVPVQKPSAHKRRIQSSRINVSETTGPWRRHRQSADAVCTSDRLIHVRQWLLRQLRPLVRSMSSDAVKVLVLTFISYRLDYCKSLFNGISGCTLSRIPLCRALDGTTTITLVLHQLHWFPILKWVDFEIPTLVYRSNFAVRHGSGLPAGR